MKKLLIELGSFFLIVILISCGDEGNNATNNFDRTLLLENIANNIITPAYTAVEANTANLSTLAGTLSSDLSEENLMKIQNAWKEAKVSWAKAEAFNFGPIADLALQTKINRWPINEFGLESFLEGKNSVTIADVEALPSNQIGFNAIEYLIFGEDALSKFNENPVRLQLVQNLASLLNTNIKSILLQWQGDYKTTFVTDNGKELESALTQFANAYIEAVDIVRNFKMSTPLGFKNSGVIQPDLVEARYSSYSKELMIANLQSFKDIFNGQSDVGNLNGFDDYLDGLNSSADEPLSMVINVNFDNTIKAINNIDGTLSEALINNPLQVNDALTEMQKLIVLLKTDMMSQLGLIVTFSDSDGD